MATSVPISPSPSQKIQEVFSAQVQNVKALNDTWTHLVRTINRDLASSARASLKAHTQLLGLVYCSWAEAAFLKLIHNPRGFSTLEISDIQSKKKAGVAEGWQRCLELGLARIVNAQDPVDMVSIEQRLSEMIDKYIKEPSLLRNKMAHGQWIVALNRENTAINADISAQIADLDVVKLTILKNSTTILINCIERLIQSPNKHFETSVRDFIAQHDQQFLEQSTWTLAAKAAILKERARAFRASA